MANTNAEIIALLQTDPSQAIRGVLDTLYLYNPATVNDLIEKLNEVIVQGGFEAIVVDTLPETGVKGTIYFVPSGGEKPNVYNEYVWVTETEKFEMVGSAQVDLSNYYTKDEVDEQLIDIVGYIGDETRPLRNDINQIDKNIRTVADWVNAKDEEGNRAVLETEAQDAYRAINELNAKIGSGGGGASLPDQTGNAGKFLMTDGTEASWGEALTNKSTHANAVAIGYNKQISTWKGDIFIGTPNTNTTGKSVGGVVVIGENANTMTSDCYTSIAIGGNALVGALRAIQLGSGGNYDAHTFKVGNGEGNFEMMSADGTIPTDRYAATPTTAGTYVPKLTVAEDGTATREWGTESGGDYLPLTGGTMTGDIIFGSTKIGIDIEPMVLVVKARDSNRTIFSFNVGGACFYSPSSIATLGASYYKWSNVYTTKLNNGANLAVPTEGGTLARLEDLNEITTVTIKEYD